VSQPKPNKIEGVPLELQLPELPRGCEVTSLAMLLASQGLNVSKLELAERIKKDNTPFQIKDSQTFYGNPHVGFVGSINDINKRGYGVYHEPIFELLNEFMPNMALDISGCDFEDLFYYLALDIPVWVISNSTYAPLPKSVFKTWNTSQGKISITYQEHSVLLIGFDEELVYFNDPLDTAISAPRALFAEAWKQMGSQAVTIMP
jgi:uncharacterized protein YvpB